MKTDSLGNTVAHFKSKQGTLYDLHFLNNKFVCGYEKCGDAGLGTYGTEKFQKKYTGEKEMERAFKFT